MGKRLSGNVSDRFGIKRVLGKSFVSLCARTDARGWMLTVGKVGHFEFLRFVNRGGRVL